MKRTIKGRLLADFRVRRQQAREDLEKELWKANKLTSKKSREGYEIRERSIYDKDGSQIIVLELVQVVDTKICKVSVDVNAEHIVYRKGKSVEELLNE